MECNCPVCSQKMRISVDNDMLTDGTYLTAQCRCGYKAEASGLDDVLALGALMDRIETALKKSPVLDQVVNG